MAKQPIYLPSYCYKAYIKLNKEILAAKTSSMIFNTTKQCNYDMNLINYSACLKKLNQFKNSDFYFQLHFQDLEAIYTNLLTLLQTVDTQVEFARPISNIYYYSSQILPSNYNKTPIINEVLEQKAINLIDSMNKQEVINLFQASIKSSNSKFRQIVLQQLNSMISTFTFHDIAKILHQLTLLNSHLEQITLRVESHLLQDNNNNNNWQMLNAIDFCAVANYFAHFQNHFASKEEFLQIFKANLYQQIIMINAQGLSSLLKSLTKLSSENIIQDQEFQILLEQRIMQIYKTATGFQISYILNCLQELGLNSIKISSILIQEAIDNTKKFDNGALIQIAYSSLNQDISISKSYLDHLQSIIQKNSWNSSSISNDPKLTEILLYVYFNAEKRGIFKSSQIFKDKLFAIILSLKNSHLEFEHLYSFIEMISFFKPEQQIKILQLLDSKIKDIIMSDNPKNLHLMSQTIFQSWNTIEQFELSNTQFDLQLFILQLLDKYYLSKSSSYQEAEISFKNFDYLLSIFMIYFSASSQNQQIPPKYKSSWVKFLIELQDHIHLGLNQHTQETMPYLAREDLASPILSSFIDYKLFSSKICSAYHFINEENPDLNLSDLIKQYKSQITASSDQK